MPSAQGHITVRRRAKDGTDGNDAVRYWVIPSATQIKRAQDGTMYPATVTCEKRKQTGNSEPIATSEGYLYYKIGYTDGSVTAKLTYGSTGVKATSGMAWIKFMLEVSQIEVASETVSVVADGRSVSGVKEWYLRWAQSSGVTTNTGGWSETVPQLTQKYKYLWNYEEISFDDGTTLKTSPAIIGVYGRGIKSVTNYYLATSSSSGVTTATKGWSTSVQSPTETDRYLWNYEVVTYDDDSTTEVAPHIICVYGQKGDPGEDAYILDLDNEMQGIPCNSSGTPTESGTLASTNSTVYKGSKIDTGWTFSKTDTDCTSSIDSKGTVSVTAISADKASVKVTATKGGITREATMSLYKIKAGGKGDPGNPGASPVVYSIETSVSAISRDANGSLTPSSMTAYKQKTVGTNTARTTEKVLKCLMEGASTTETIIANAGTEGSEISGITDNCTAVVLTLYDGTTILDKERIPIVKDGTNGIDGEDAISILISPENIEFNYSKSVVKQTVKVNAYKGGKKLNYSDDEFVCSTLTSNGSGKEVTTGLRWNFEVDGTDFYYTFIYIAGNDIDITIPFTVTVDNVQYERAIYVHTVKNGSQGVPGPLYKPLRVRKWSDIPNNTQLTTGLKDSDDWTDIVYVLTDSVESGVKYWKCINDFTKSNGQTPPNDSDTPSTNSLVGYLQKTTNFGSLATDIFLANYALIRNLGVETIDMRDSSGNVLFQAKNGVVTCNTGNFTNVNVSGGLKASTLDLKISTKDHNGDTSPEPNGSICLNADRILLPDLTPGSVRTIRVLNPLETRTTPNDLILSLGSTNVRISSTLSALDAKASQISLAGYGMNGGVYLELLGYRKADSNLTYWLTKKLAEVT